MNAEQFLKEKNGLLLEQAKHTEYINGKFNEIGQAFLKENCPFTIGQTVDVGERKLLIQHIEPLTWFEFVMIRLYGTYDNDEVEQNGVALSDQIKLSENQEIPCQDKQEV